MSKADSKHAIVMALWYEELNKNSICPYNHDLYHDNGWFKFDDNPSERKSDIMEKAQELVDQGCTGHFRHHGMRDIPEIEYPEDCDE